MFRGTGQRETKEDSAPIDLSAVVAEKFIERRKIAFPTLQPGFTFEGTGRCGYVYFKEQERLLEVYWEMSGVPQFDYLLSPQGLSEWCYPARVPVSPARQSELLAELKAWLSAKKIRTDL